MQLHGTCKNHIADKAGMWPKAMECGIDGFQFGDNLFSSWTSCLEEENKRPQSFTERVATAQVKSF